MRVAFWLPVWAVLIATNMSAGVVEYSATDLSTNLSRYDYLLSGMAFQANQPNQQYLQLDIRFDPTLYSSLSNPQVLGGFTTLLLQPNNPPGIFGDFVIMPLTGDLSQIGHFSVDVVSIGHGPLGPQPLFVNQFDAAGNYLFTLEAGFTVPDPAVPEPAVFPLVGIGLLVSAGWWRIRKRSVRARAGQ